MEAPDMSTVANTMTIDEFSSIDGDRTPNGLC